jgi:hypothetical protein
MDILEILIDHRYYLTRNSNGEIKLKIKNKNKKMDTLN